VVVVEKEAAGLALHQSKRNSGVIHAGLYYREGSRRAALCVRGAEMMYAYCEEKGLPVERVGKLVVAVRPDELPRLDALFRRGPANGVRGLRLVDGAAAIRAIEPACRGLRAIHSPNTGITDFHRVALQMAADFVALGGEIRTGFHVDLFEFEGGGGGGGALT